MRISRAIVDGFDPQAATWRRLALALVLGFGSLGGCGGPPETCKGCLAALGDGGPRDVSSAGSGGGSGASGGSPGSGGSSVLGSGGLAIASGGVSASGGRSASGGAGVASGGAGTGSGGTGTGGTGSSASGGTTGSTGGSGSGGIGTGGESTGGSGSGGVTTGGAGVGGASTGGMGSGGTGTGGAAGDADLVLWYKFDETTGTTAGDSAMAGGVPRPGTLRIVGTGTAMFSTTHQVGTHAVSLVSTGSTAGGYLSLPQVQDLAPAALTIATWVNLTANTAAQNWERVFDFGLSPTVYMFLTARTLDAPNAVRFAISTTGNVATAEQRLTGAAPLTAGAWHHLAVVLQAGAPYTGRLYIDGVQVATNAAMTLHPSDLGATTGNYIGRSQFVADPYFNGMVDDFRVYKRALTGNEISTLFQLR